MSDEPGQKSSLKRKSNENENSNNKNIENVCNSSHSSFQPPLNKKKKLRINKEDEDSPAFMCNANEVIFFKITHTKEEFENFQNLSNFEQSFNSSFSNQIFPNEETITGYKNLKILISLTPMMLHSHVKIIYEKCLKIKDDLEMLLKSHFDYSYETNSSKYLEKLENERGITPKGKLIYEEVNKKSGKCLEIFQMDIIKDNAYIENWNFQCLCTFFIDGASFIPFENTFWKYFILYEKVNNNWNLIGFASCLNLNLSLVSHRSMVSQFITLPNYQRQGFGHFLLDKIYNFFTLDDCQCIEITTEDPAEEFILLRDITIFNKIMYLGLFDRFISNWPVNSLDNFNKIIFTNEEIEQTFLKIKVTKNLIKRSVLLLKFILSADNKLLFGQFKKDCQSLIYKWNRADFEFDYFIKRNKKGGPYICFHDDEYFSVEESLNQLSSLNSNDQTKSEKLETLFSEMESELKKITGKCARILHEYRTEKFS